MNYFLSGSIFAAALISALFFLRFYKDSGDRFFLLFSLAFLLLGIERLPLLLVAANSDTRGSIYIFRLCAYIVILCAIFYKNRARSKTSTSHNHTD